MITEDNFQNAAASQNGAASPLEMARVPDWRWLLKWVALTTAAIPVGIVTDGAIRRYLDADL